MKLIVKGRHMKLTQALRTFAEDKLGHAVMRIFDRPAVKTEIELIDLGEIKDKNNKECHVTVHIPKGKTIVISEVNEDMYKAINLAHDRLLINVKRERARRQHAAQRRKSAERQRHQTARSNLTTQPERWEQEVREYERSTVYA